MEYGHFPVAAVTQRGKDGAVMMLSTTYGLENDVI